MQQTLDLTQNATSLLHWGLGEVLPVQSEGWKGFLSKLGIVAVDFLATPYPLSFAWMHEEWHRAVMSHRGVDSKNDINDITAKKGSLIAVSHEDDVSLSSMKRNHPKDFIRLSAAGIESSHALTVSIQRSHFFQGASTWDFGTLWLAQLNPITYLGTCNSDSSNEDTRRIEEKEGKDVAKRDFIGLDCTGWVRDLHRPREEFETRGTHPSGVGVRRYTRQSDLTDEEKKYLRLQKTLSYLNLVDPFLLGFKSFALTSPITGRELGWNAALGHDLSPFGHSLSLRVMFKTLSKQTPFGTQGMFFRYFHHFNKNSSFPGLEIDHEPVPLGDSQWFLGARLMAWTQPKNLDFDTKKSEAGGLIGTKLVYGASEKVLPWIQLSAKTKGWVIGDVELGKGQSVQFGIDSRWN